MTPVLSVVMPVYNEAATIQKIVEAVLAQPIVAELIVVDDGSNDRTGDVLTGRQAGDWRLVIERHKIKEDRFGIEPEMTAKIARLGVAVYEVAISYSGRTYAQGKKVTWRDGLSALRCVIQYNLLQR